MILRHLDTVGSLKGDVRLLNAVSSKWFKDGKDYLVKGVSLNL